MRSDDSEAPSSGLRRGAVHRGFVRGIVTHIVVIDDLLRLDFGELVRLIQVQTLKLS
jgi:hypothetical protein